MYPLDQGRWGPTVRISHLHHELAQLVDVDLIAAYRGARRKALVRYALTGRLRELDGIYVESSTFLPAEIDIMFLGLARALGIPVLTYVRDAYQLFDEYYDVTSVRRWLAARAFLPALRALGAVSSALAFPSAGLARAVVGSDVDVILIPPGSPPPVDVPRAADAHRLLFVGNGRTGAQGAPRLIRAVDLARARGSRVELTIVSRPGEEPEPPHPAWLRVVHAEGRQIDALLPDVIATVIPRPRGAYNDLAVPVKLYDYLAYGRPLLVTDCLEQAAVVREVDAGIVTADDESEIADGILRLMSARATSIDRWSDNARDAARSRSWRSRAEEILNTLRLLR
ncbi:MAG: glycosyltransferase [Candidatus Limnocylindria bacterium]